MSKMIKVGINYNQVEIPKELAIESTTIKDMLDDCGYDQESIHIDSLHLSVINAKDIELLLKVFPHISHAWKEESSKIERARMFEIAKMMNMRRIMSYMMYSNVTLFRQHISDQDVMKACLEHCNGYAYHLLQKILELDDRKVFRLACTMLQDFVAAEQYSKYWLYEVRLNGTIIIFLLEQKYALKRIKASEYEKYRLPGNSEFYDDGNAIIPMDEFTKISYIVNEPFYIFCQEKDDSNLYALALEGYGDGTDCRVVDVDLEELSTSSTEIFAVVPVNSKYFLLDTIVFGL